MNKKTIIQLVIIVVAFGAAGLVLYNGIFKDNSGSQASSADSGNSFSVGTSPEALLPYGTTTNFSILKSRPFTFDQVDFPALDKQKDIGVAEDTMIKSSQ